MGGKAIDKSKRIVVAKEQEYGWGRNGGGTGQDPGQDLFLGYLVAPFVIILKKKEYRGLKGKSG